MDFAMLVNPSIKWKVMVDIEAKAIKRKEDRVMTILEMSKERLKQQAMLRGLRQGREEGREEGREDRIREVIQNMLKKKTDIAFISEVTGVSQKEIKRFQNGRLQNGHFRNGKGRAGGGRNSRVKK